MIFTIQGNEQINATKEILTAVVSDMNNFIKLIPDIKEVKELTNEKAHVLVATGLSFVKGDLDATIDLVKQEEQYVMNVFSKGIGSSSKVKIIFTPEESLIKWQLEVLELGGLLKLVPSSLLKGAAMKITNEVIAEFKKSVG